MTQTNYEKGRAYEYKVKRKLEAEGWTVLRTAGSHGEFDLVAIKHIPDADRRVLWTPQGAILTGSAIRLIQCKTGKSKKRAISEVEKSDIKKYEGVYSVSVEVV